MRLSARGSGFIGATIAGIRPGRPNRLARLGFPGAETIETIAPAIRRWPETLPLYMQGRDAGVMPTGNFDRTARQGSSGMTHRGSNALQGREHGWEALTGAAAHALKGAADAILGRVATGLAHTRAAAGALRDLSTIEDHVFRDIGLNRALIDRSDYRIARGRRPSHDVRH